MASRKRRKVGQTEEAAWAGLVVIIKEGQVYMTVSQKKWDKFKKWINWIEEEMEKHIFHSKS